MPTMNEWQQQIAEERKAQEKWQTMTLEELEASYAFKENCRSSCKWLGLKQADRVNGVTHAPNATAPEPSGADQHEVNILDD